MKNSKLHKRQIFYIVLYSILIVLSAIFLTVVFLFPNITLQSLTGVIFLLWLPLAFTTIITDLPQTVAGNIFMYKNIKDLQKRDYKLKTYSSANFTKSDFYKYLILDNSFTKIKSVRVDRKFKKENKNDKNSYFLVILKNTSEFRITVIKRNKNNENQYTTKWIVDNVEQISGNDVLQDYRDKVLSDVLFEKSQEEKAPITQSQNQDSQENKQDDKD